MQISGCVDNDPTIVLCVESVIELPFPQLEVHVWTVNGGVKALRREFPDADDQFPRPLNGLFFEIIAETPVAEHLEKRVVIGVEADVVEVVVLAAGADALLRIRRASGRVGALGLAKED